MFALSYNRLGLFLGSNVVDMVTGQAPERTDFINLMEDNFTTVSSDTKKILYDPLQIFKDYLVMELPYLYTDGNCNYMTIKEWFTVRYGTICPKVALGLSDLALISLCQHTSLNDMLYLLENLPHLKERVTVQTNGISFLLGCLNNHGLNLTSTYYLFYRWGSDAKYFVVSYKCIPEKEDSRPVPYIGMRDLEMESAKNLVFMMIRKKLIIIPKFTLFRKWLCDYVAQNPTGTIAGFRLIINLKIEAKISKYAIMLMPEFRYKMHRRMINKITEKLEFYESIDKILKANQSEITGYIGRNLSVGSNYKRIGDLDFQIKISDVPSDELESYSLAVPHNMFKVPELWDAFSSDQQMTTMHYDQDSYYFAITRAKYPEDYNVNVDSYIGWRIIYNSVLKRTKRSKSLDVLIADGWLANSTKDLVTKMGEILYRRNLLVKFDGYCFQICHIVNYLECGINETMVLIDDHDCVITVKGAFNLFCATTILDEDCELINEFGTKDTYKFIYKQKLLSRIKYLRDLNPSMIASLNKQQLQTPVDLFIDSFGLVPWNGSFRGYCLTRPYTVSELCLPKSMNDNQAALMNKICRVVRMRDLRCFPKTNKDVVSIYIHMIMFARLVRYINKVYKETVPDGVLRLNDVSAVPTMLYQILYIKRANQLYWAEFSDLCEIFRMFIVSLNNFVAMDLYDNDGETRHEKTLARLIKQIQKNNTESWQCIPGLSSDLMRSICEEIVVDLDNDTASYRYLCHIRKVDEVSLEFKKMYVWKEISHMGGVRASERIKWYYDQAYKALIESLDYSNFDANVREELLAVFRDHLSDDDSGKFDSVDYSDIGYYSDASNASND